MDTNILVYATHLASPYRDVARTALERATRRDTRLCVSRQVLREYLAVVTRPQLFARPVPMLDALADVAGFTNNFEILEDGPAVGAQLIELCRTVPVAGRQVHDVNIVATMVAHGESRLLTSNRSDFKRFAHVIEVVAP